MESKLRLTPTDDGSFTLLNTEINEFYHCLKGAKAETEHVYIQQGLAHYLSTFDGQHITIGEFGFGTGLGALLTLAFIDKYNQHRSAQSKITIRFISFEPSPIPLELVSQLGVDKYSEPKLYQHYLTMHQAPWDKEVQITPHFILHKVKAPMTPACAEFIFNVIYFDAFAPARQGDAWHIDTVTCCVNALAPQGLLVSYCANGQFKRDLKSLNMIVDKKCQGALGKREMTRARKA